MSQQQEKLSAFMDGEEGDSNVVSAIQSTDALRQSWQRYHVVRTLVRKEGADFIHIDISQQIAAALNDEPSILVPHKRRQFVFGVSQLKRLARHSGQYAVAASVAVAVILGVQLTNEPVQREAFSTARTVGPAGGLAPVSLEQTRTLPREDMAVLLERKRKINALIADHEQQVRLKHAHATTSQDVEQADAASTDANGPRP